MISSKERQAGFASRKPTMKDVIREAVRKPNLILVTGRMGYGKTFLCQFLLAWNLLTPDADGVRHGYAIANGKLLRWERPDDPKPVRATMDRYYFSTTLANILVAISEILYADPNAHIEVFVDEGQNGLDALSYSGGLGKNFKKWLGLLRKLRASCVIATPRARWLLKSLRGTEEGKGKKEGDEEEGGMAAIQFKKDPITVNRYGDKLLRKGHEMKEVAVLHWPDAMIFNEAVLVPPAPILAIPEDEARRTGQAIFDTLGISDLEEGVHPLTGKKINFGEMLSRLSEECDTSYDYPQWLYNYFHVPGFAGEVVGAPPMSRGEEMRGLDEPANAEPRRVGRPEPLPAPGDRAGLDEREPERAKPRRARTNEKSPTQHGVKPEVERMIHAGGTAKDVMEATGCSERWYYTQKKECKEARHI